jgi:hypothetical protein
MYTMRSCRSLHMASWGFSTQLALLRVVAPNAATNGCKMSI